MTGELEVVRNPEILQENQGDVWESAVSEWSSGQSQAILGQLRQARAAAAIQSVYGTSSMKSFADEVGAAPSTCYEYAKVWNRYGYLIEDGSGQFYERLESGFTTMSHLIKALRSPDPRAAIEEAADDGISAREMERRQKTEEEPQRVEKVEITECPHCGSDAKYWSRVPEV